MMDLPASKNGIAASRIDIASALEPHSRSSKMKLSFVILLASPREKFTHSDRDGAMDKGAAVETVLRVWS